MVEIVSPARIAAIGARGGAGCARLLASFAGDLRADLLSAADDWDPAGGTQHDRENTVFSRSACANWLDPVDRRRLSNAIPPR
jgi:hypothetical protein